MPTLTIIKKSYRYCRHTMTSPNNVGVATVDKSKLAQTKKLIKHTCPSGHGSDDSESKPEGAALVEDQQAEINNELGTQRKL